MPYLLSAAPFEAFSLSDPFGKVIVLLLIFLSIGAWFLMVEKFITLRQSLSDSQKMLSMFTHGSYIKYLKGTRDNHDPISHIYHAGIEQLLESLAVDENQLLSHAKHQLLPRQLTAIESETVRNSLDKAVNTRILELEDRMGLLATIVSVSPFFGLLGTVWGVMGAFSGMAAKGSADMAALAPGISAALLTTVVGLVVAIPSLIGYNILANTLKKQTVIMDTFVEEFMANITTHRVKAENHGQT